LYIAYIHLSAALRMKSNIQRSLALVAGAILVAAAFSVASAIGAMAYPQGSTGSSSTNNSSTTNGDPGLGAATGVWNLTKNNSTGTAATNSSMMQGEMNYGGLSDLFAMFNQNLLFGTIAGEQSSAAGGGEGQQPDWILSGNWVLTFEPSNTTKSSENSTSNATTGTASSMTDNKTAMERSDLGASTGIWNITGENSTNAESWHSNMLGTNNSSFDMFARIFGNGPKDIANVTGFNALIVMVKPDGTALHTHTISNFTQTQNVTNQGNTTTIKGTSTITMRDGPVNDVPTTISISQNGTVIALSFDEPKVNDHFGNSPIYGIGVTKELIQAQMKEFEQHGNMTSGTMSSGQNMTTYGNSTLASPSTSPLNSTGMK
jgi:hypothetical protein